MYLSSSTASSIYSQDGVLYPSPYEDFKPLITRKVSNSSKASNNPTIYTEEQIKSLGYRPFEYWKGPQPVAYVRNKDSSKTRAPIPPPRRASTIAPRRFRRSIGSLRGLRLLPEVKLQGGLGWTAEEDDEVEPPLRSPRVKDRYRKRYQQPSGKENNWPGWVPDERVYKTLSAQSGRSDGSYPSKRYSEMIPLILEGSSKDGNYRTKSEQFWKLGTWGRRNWSIMLFLFTLVVIVLIILSTTLTQNKDNTPSRRQTDDGQGMPGDLFVSYRRIHGGSLFHSQRPGVL